MSDRSNGVAPEVLALPLTFDAAVEEFADWLGKLGYATATVREKVRFVTVLANWMKARDLSVADLDERRVGAAVKHRGVSSGNRRRALLHFLEFLRDRRVVAPLKMPDDRSSAAQLEER